jgi:vacuolar-type H+-ATPase subunit I/STV1
MKCEDPEIFYSQKNKLHQSYVNQLNKTMKEYPSYKMETENKYQEQLSLLNGISKKIKDLRSLVREKTSIANQNIQEGDVELRKLKKVERNLSNYTSYEKLDITSQQLLSDAMQEYTQEKIVFYVKAIVLFFLFYLLYQRIKRGSWMETMATVGGAFVLFLIVSLYRYFTSKG